jgi:hypothetical protein
MLIFFHFSLKKKYFLLYFILLFLIKINFMIFVFILKKLIIYWKRGLNLKLKNFNFIKKKFNILKKINFFKKFFYKKNLIFPFLIMEICHYYY